MLPLSVAIFLIYIVSSSNKYCAWNRATKPVSENNAGTYNFLNGEFDRWYAFYTGNLWHGQPYYRQELTSCYVTNLFLFRYANTHVWPPTYTWVIAANMGVKPIYGYAYCTVSTSLQKAPNGACDGMWKVGQPQDDNAGVTAAQTLDTEFFVQQGGCPQSTCASLVYSNNMNDDWAGTYTYYQANIYRQSGRTDTSESGEYYLFFNPKVWRWAVNEFIDEYLECEQYKLGKGFTSVANVIPGSQSNSLKSAGGFWYYTPSTGSARVIECQGTITTPSPTSAVSLVPTISPLPQTENWCSVEWMIISPLLVQQIVALCGCTDSLASSGQCTMYPTTAGVKLTASPASSPVSSPVYNPASSPAYSPAYAPASSPAYSPVASTPTTPPPTTPGTAKPTSPTTAAPTNIYGTARPTMPTTAAPTSAGTAKPTTPTSSNNNNNNDDANRLCGRVYVLASVLAVYNLLF